MLKQILQLRYLQSNTIVDVSDSLDGSVCFQACVSINLLCLNY